jgi:pimeloyl-ACP methyl ester carboxylesterase
MFARLSAVLFAGLLALAAVPAVADGPADNIPDNVRPIPPKGDPLPADVQETLRTGLGELQALIKDIGNHDLLPDVLIYEKAVRWALDYNEVFDAKPGKDKKGPPPANNVRKVLAAGLERAKQLKDGKTPWTTQTGPVLRGYRSKIDGSVQPYWLVVPAGYDGLAKTPPHRLDFWWHGRGETLTEANFMAGAPGPGGIIPAEGAFILHPYGRYCNANKFAGEIDTFECLEHAQKHYRIDATRLVARGFSMGGAACWQFTVHYPTLWAASAPGAGFAETPEFLNNFQGEKVQPTWYEQKLWHLYNATDYALNVFDVPTVAYSGADDKQKQAADVMAREMGKVGLKLTHVIGPKTGHSYEPEARKVVNKLIDEIVAKGRDPWPAEFKFVTHTLRYNCGPGIEITGLGRHWDQARVEGTRSARSVTAKTANVESMTVSFPAPVDAVSLEVDGTKLTLPGSAGPADHAVRLRRDGEKWVPVLPATAQRPVLAKKPGLQGPIDDAFLDRFVMVRPTGKAMNAAVGAWAEKELAHAMTHWRKQFRGDAPVTDDTKLTDEQVKNANLVLWGDPQSNAVLAKIADKLPVKWTADGVAVGDNTYDAGTHVPVLIYPNPLNPRKYVVLNSGFTFREYAQLNNARQVPMLPDYAVLDVTTPPNSRWPGKVVRAGFFGEKWELQSDDGK